MDYDVFSHYYDLLTQDVDYKSRTEYLIKLFNKYGKTPSLLLDLGCGTGGFSLEFAEKGIDVIGVDPSFGMVSVAKERAEEKGLDLLFLNQSGEELDLYGTVDGAVCCLDTVNHIISKRELQRTFNKVRLFLEQGCLFIFDVNTLFKQETVLGNNTFVYDTDGVYCVWQNSFDKKTGITDICLDFFEKGDNGYKRTTEEFSERVYEKQELEALLKKAGLSLVACFGENTFSAPKKTTQRCVIVARKG